MPARARPTTLEPEGRRADALPVVSICGAAEPMIEDCPEEMLELRATLLQEHVWRQREGLLQMITGSGVRLPAQLEPSTNDGDRVR